MRIAWCSVRRSSAVDVDGESGRIDARPPQHLVDEQVAEPGDPVLVHEHRLDRRVRVPSACVELP